MVRILRFSIIIFSLVILTSCYLKQPQQQTVLVTPIAHSPLSPLVKISPLPTPSPTSKPLPSLTPTTEPTPTIVPTPIPTITSNPIIEFPLTIGNIWVYSATYRGKSFDFEALTATYIITNQVVDTQIYSSSMFGAVLQRTSLLISGSPYKEFNISEYIWTLENPEPHRYSYVISNNKIYQQNELDFQNLRVRVTDSGPYKYPLVYEFPFINEAGFNCWYPGISETGYCHDPAEGILGGFYYVSDGPISITTSAGKFKNCYVIGMSQRYQKFCFNIGIVDTDWKYTRQMLDSYPPLGYNIKLITYTLVSSDD